MKKFFTALLLLSVIFAFCQKVELKKVTDSSQIFKGEIAGSPITIQLYYAGIPDCSLYQYFVDGWYYYDKYQKKIPLTGIYDYGKLSLYNFGSKQKQNSKIFRENITSPQTVEKTQEIAEKLNPKESIIFQQDDLKENLISGNFYLDKKTLSAKLFTGNDMIYRYNNYLISPNNKRINTFDVINKHGGNELVSFASGEKGIGFYCILSILPTSTPAECAAPVKAKKVTEFSILPKTGITKTMKNSLQKVVSRIFTTRRSQKIRKPKL